MLSQEMNSEYISPVHVFSLGKRVKNLAVPWQLSEDLLVGYALKVYVDNTIPEAARTASPCDIDSKLLLLSVSSQTTAKPTQVTFH
jgi:hypothetical protein